MIVRDEEATLGRCLESVAGVFDEIVIADTGSRDATREVAATHGARVVEFPWVDDFAAARNFAFEQATGDYLMWLDADDVLLDAERMKLLALKADLDGQLDAVSMEYHTAFDEAGNVMNATRRFRIVRRGAGFRWVGAVHEDLEAGETYKFLDTNIVITHRKPPGDGGPSQRNLKILERMVAEGRAMRPADLLNYARELEMNKRYAEAIPYYEQFLATPQQSPDVTVFALHKLASCYYVNGQPEMEWQCTLRSLDVDVPRPEFACRIGERFIARNQFRQAAYWYEVALSDPGGASSTWTIENHAFKTWLPHKQLGLCYYQLGDYQRSLQHNLEAQRYRPDDPDIATNVGVLRDMLARSTS